VGYMAVSINNVCLIIYLKLLRLQLRYTIYVADSPYFSQITDAW
jgi:hypothetical protein